MYVDAKHSNWDMILPFSTYAYNTTQQATTGYSPFRLVYGRNVRTPMDDMFLTAEKDSLQTGSKAYLEAAEDARRLARQSIVSSQRLQKLVYDSQHPDREFQVGDLVLVRKPNRKIGLAEKLMQKYFGPYQVIERTSAVNYRVSTLPVGADATTDIVHSSRMKPYDQRAPEVLV